MTVYVLAGGRDRQYPDYQARLAQLILREIPNPRILSCMFAWPKEFRQARYAEYAQWFREGFGETVDLTYAQESSFYDQIDSADVVYLHGGRTKLLLDAIQDIDRFREAIKGKIVVGSSAGANFLSTVCFSPSAESVFNAAGILDVGVVVHYGIEAFEEKTYTIEFWHSAVTGVRNKLGTAKPLLILPEGHFTVLTS